MAVAPRLDDRLAKEAAKWGAVPGLEPDTRRKLDLLRGSLTLAAPEVAGSATEINTIATRIAEINAAMPAATANNGGLTLRDEQATLVRRLSEVASVGTIAREDGGVDVSIGNGRALGCCSICPNKSASTESNASR